METKHIALKWNGGLRFQGGEPNGPQAAIDADNSEAPGPMVLLLMAAASCSAADVVSILDKMRERLTGLHVDARGVRQDEQPRRYVGVTLAFKVSGVDLDEAKVRRAIDLSVEKYCSVMHSLAPDIVVTTELEMTAAVA